MPNRNNRNRREDEEYPEYLWALLTLTIIWVLAHVMFDIPPHM